MIFYDNVRWNIASFSSFKTISHSRGIVLIVRKKQFNDFEVLAIFETTNIADFILSFTNKNNDLKNAFGHYFDNINLIRFIYTKTSRIKSNHIFTSLCAFYKPIFNNFCINKKIIDDGDFDTNSNLDINFPLPF